MHAAVTTMDCNFLFLYIIGLSHCFLPMSHMRERENKYA